MKKRNVFASAVCLLALMPLGFAHARQPTRASSDPKQAEQKFGKTFHERLRRRLQSQLGGVVKGDIAAIQPSDFNWFWDLNKGFNKNTWSFIDRIAVAGDRGGIVLKDGMSFSDTYSNEVLSSIDFKLSNKSEADIREAATLASASAREVVRQYEESFGDISEDKIKKAAGEMGRDETDFTKLDYVISYRFAYEWTCRKAMKKPPLALAALDRNDLPNTFKCASPEAAYLAQPIADWLDMSDQVLGIMDEENQNTAKLHSLRRNARIPAKSNGGLETDDGAWRPKYNISKPVETIIESLKSGNSISLNIRAVHQAGGQTKVSIEGSGGGVLPFGAFLYFGTKSQSKFNLFDYHGLSNEMNMKMSWRGVTVIDVNAEPYARPTVTDHVQWPPCSHV